MRGGASGYVRMRAWPHDNGGAIRGCRLCSGGCVNAPSSDQEKKGRGHFQVETEMRLKSHFCHSINIILVLIYPFSSLIKKYKKTELVHVL